jgi:tetratricopeptide (TPR) repeat protein
MILKKNLSKILFLICSVFCLNLSHAQSNSLVNQTLGTLQAGATPDPNVSIGTLGVGNGKYEEYQSVCRVNEYDTVRYYSTDLKKKRSDLLKQRISEAGDNSTKITLRLIKELIDQGEAKETRIFIDALKNKKLSNFDNSYLNALVSMSTENYATARATLSKLLEDDPKNQDVLRLLAEVFVFMQNYYEASTIYEDLNTFTKNAYLIQQCETLILNSLNADGEKVCLRAAKKFPESPLPHIYIGISHREREDYKQALLAFKKAVSIKPTEMGTTCLAEQYFIKQDYANAIIQFQQSSTLNPDSIRAQLGLAWTQIKTKQFAESLIAFKKVCAINSKYQIELRKAFKILSADKIPDAKKFIQAAESCGG